ncbi:MAG: hypothetical protein Q8M07_14720, partial [Prosthecobacter sp.]|nr:hypothetical protein [Prosthecobacter sp.]
DPDAWAFASALLDTPRQDVLDVMRGILARALEKAAGGGDHKLAASNLPSAVYLYLLAYGGSEDARRIAAVPLGYWMAAQLSVIAANPIPLARHVAKLRYYDELRTMTPWLRDLPPDRAGEVAATFEDLVWEHAAANGDRVAGNSALNRHKALISFCSPNSVPARFYGEGKMLIEETAWVPTILHAGKSDEFLQSMVKGDLRDGYEAQTDYLSGEELVRAAGAAKAADALPHFEVYLAAHRICTRGYFSTADSFHDGVERRPYTLRLKDGSGSLSGVLEMRPWRVEGRLRLALRMVQTPFYNAGDFISAAMLKEGRYYEWAHHKFVVNGGAGLLGSVQLQRGDAALPLRACGRTEDGAFLYETTTATDNSPAGLVLHVSLAFPDQPATLTYDLSTSDLARRLRNLEGRLPALEKAERWVEAGRVLQSMGRLSEAWERYQRALTKDPTRTDLIDTAIQMFSQNGLHDRAASLLRDQTKARPEDTAAWRDLAGELYLDGAYRESAEAAGHVLSLNPADKPAALMRAMSLFLAGDRAAAATALDAIVVELPRVIPLRHLCQADAPAAQLQAYHGSVKDDERKVVGLLLGHGAPADIAAVMQEPAQVCKAWCFSGYRQLQAGKKDEARKAFTAALETGQERQLEFRMAQVELEQLK